MLARRKRANGPMSTSRANPALQPCTLDCSQSCSPSCTADRADGHGPSAVGRGCSATVGGDPGVAGLVQRDVVLQRPVEALRRARVVRRVQTEGQLPIQLHQGNDGLRSVVASELLGVM